MAARCNTYTSLWCGIQITGEVTLWDYKLILGISYVGAPYIYSFDCIQFTEERTHM